MVVSLSAKITAIEAEIVNSFEAANARLKASGMRVGLLRRNQSIYVRSSLFPPKPGSGKTKPHRQEVPAGAYWNVEGVRFAENVARKIGLQLAIGEFDWREWMAAPPPENSDRPVSHWVELLRQQVMERCKEITWRKDYLYIYKKLPQDEPLTAEMLMGAIADTEANSKTRKRTVMALGRLGKLAGIECDLSGLGGNYGIKSTASRKIPSDEDILYWYRRIDKERDRWAYGMMAAFGIRPHEIFHINRERLKEQPDRVEIAEETKTGHRTAWALPPEWSKEFDLLALPRCSSNAKDNSSKGQLIARWFKQHNIPFKPYDLRHAWAIRAIHWPLDDSIAAAMMGHSVSVHCKTYKHWLQTRDFERAIAGK
jgi:hypothetical protein